MFQFRLQTLLRLRLAERDQRRADLAKAIRAEEMLHVELQDLARQQAGAADRGRKLKSPGTADIDSLLQTHRFATVLAAQERQLKAQLAQVQVETERRRQVLVEADRQVRVLEKLRQRQAAAYQKEEERRLLKQLDEAALVAYARRRRQEATA